MIKKTKEQIYRSRRTGTRWRFIEETNGSWLMAQVKDGHRLLFKVEELITEEEWFKLHH